MANKHLSREVTTCSGNHINASQEPVKKRVPLAFALHIIDLILVAGLVYIALTYMPDKGSFYSRFKSNLAAKYFVVSSVMCAKNVLKFSF